MGEFNASIKGLEKVKYFGAFWLVVGIALSWIDPAHAVVIIGALILGAIGAVLQVQLFAKGHLKWGDRASLIVGVILVASLFCLPGELRPRSVWGYLAVGALAAGSLRLITGLSEGYIN